MTESKIADLREYEVVCFYHTNETYKHKVWARTSADAQAIAKMSFAKTHTDKCILDKAEVIA